MKTCPTYTADIYCGLRKEYSAHLNDVKMARDAIQSYVNKVGLGVSFTETTFYYTDGYEPGFIVGLINYPRFPSSNDEVKKKALYLAEILMNMLEQERVSIVCSDETIMLEKS